MGQSNVTINGEPLDKVIAAEQAKEIAQVHRADSKPFPIRKHAITKHERASGRSKSGQVIYQAGQKETHVIIAGLVLPWHVKAPYVRSGESILGALEYNEAADELKCHECGEWFKKLASHSQAAHGIVRKEYKRKHGLTSTRSLCAAKLQQQYKERGQRVFWSNLNAEEREARVKLVRGTLHANREHRRVEGMAEASQAARQRAANGMGFTRLPELANLEGKCKAQLSARIVAYAKEIGRTPTKRELDALGMYEASLRRLFGMPISAVLATMGLKPRRVREHAALEDKRRAGGLIGVNRTQFNSWAARIGVEGKEVYLGTHSTLFEAACARKSAEDRLVGAGR